MRIKMEITDLGPTAWNVLNRTLRTEYHFVTPTQSRACATFVRTGGAEERHVEMPLSPLRDLMKTLELAHINDEYERRRVAAVLES